MLHKLLRFTIFISEYLYSAPANSRTVRVFYIPKNLVDEAMKNMHCQTKCQYDDTLSFSFKALAINPATASSIQKQWDSNGLGFCFYWPVICSEIRWSNLCRNHSGHHGDTCAGTHMHCVGVNCFHWPLRDDVLCYLFKLNINVTALFLMFSPWVRLGFTWTPTQCEPIIRTLH